MAEFKDYYDILGVNPKATPDEITKAWKDKHWILSIDRMGGAPETAKRRAEEELKRVNNAYDVLKDPQKRLEYDRQWFQVKDKPKPVVDPQIIHFDNVNPKEVKTGSFSIRNLGGSYNKINISNPNSWVKVIRWSSLSDSDELPLQVEIEATGEDFGKNYTEQIKVNLDDEETNVRIELQTNSGSGTPVGHSPGNGSSRVTKRGKKGLPVIAAIFAIIIIVLGIILLHSHKTPNTETTKIPGTTTSKLTSVVLTANPGEWSTTGSMSTPRSEHTATLLPNGKVLVAGGMSGNGTGFLSSAELYDPSIGTWSETGSMNTPRACHTATLLPNGQVLVTGGYTTSGFTSSAELYNPSTGTWTPARSMSTPRACHTATLLPNGKVLVAGGRNPNAILSSAEIYDPSTGTWLSTSSMSIPRSNFTATLLTRGLVLIAGGDGADGSLLSSAELYDPSTRTWTNTGSMDSPRDGPATILLPDGRVLVAGTSGNPVSAAELYDPTKGTWSNTNAMNSVRYCYNLAATLLPNGLILVTGGEGTSGVLASADLYDLSTDKWYSTGSMSTPREWLTTTLLQNGTILATGGCKEGSIPLSSAELYTPPDLDVK